MKNIEVCIDVNASEYRRSVEPRKNLADFLREDLGFTGTHVGCEHGVCGACTVMMDGVPVRACLTLIGQADNKKVQTIEGFKDDARMESLREAFLKHNALQCGFCTPGMLATALSIVQSQRLLSRQEIRDELSGNFCRCTGYESIVDAIEEVAKVFYEENRSSQYV